MKYLVDATELREATKPAPAALVIEWLARLQDSHDVTVQRVSVDAEGKPGLINAQIRLL